MPYIEVPANFGDEIYAIHSTKLKGGKLEYHIQKAVVGAIHIGRRLYCQNEEPTDRYIRLVDPKTGYHSDRISFSRFHEYCFTTYEEAEAQLKKLEEGEL